MASIAFSHFDSPLRLSHPTGQLFIRIRTTLLGFILAAVITVPAGALTVIPPTFEELVAGSGEIVRARVISVEPFLATSPDGQSIIKTRVVWQVLRQLKGNNEETLSLDFLGGRVGDDEMRVGGMPEFKKGQEDYLFVEQDTRVFCPLFAAGHGRYRVLKDENTGRAYVARENGFPLTDVSQVAVPLDEPALAARAPEAVTPEAFEAAILGTLGGNSRADAK